MPEGLWGTLIMKNAGLMRLISFKILYKENVKSGSAST
jgi:hypothetical protein